MQQMTGPRQRQYEQFGRVQSIHFDGVNQVGWDMYKVQYEHGTLYWHLWFDVAGKVADAVALNDDQR